MLKDSVFLSNLPHQPGVYQMLGSDDKILYIGKALDLSKRVSSYFRSQSKDPKTESLMEHAQRIEVTITRTEHEALLLECFLIKKHRPRYNILMRDDKSFPYILITNDKPYPRIIFYRGLKKPKGIYFGPYPNATAVRESIHIIQKVFHLRGCDNGFFANRSRPCLQHQIGLCSGPCAALISPEEYAENLKHAILFLKGKSQEIILILEKRMAAASKALNYEYAARLRDQISYLEEIQERQYVAASTGEADVIAVAFEAGVASLHCLSIREGRLLGSRSYFPSLPSDSSPSEIISAFIGQHYLANQMEEAIPALLVVGRQVEESTLLEKALSEVAKHKVKIFKPTRGERRKWLEMAQANAEQALGSYLIQKANINQRLAALQQTLKLKKLPQRIECYDVSHSMGEETVASCVVFNRDGPLKSDYRRFNITDITPGDDIAAMRQVLSRRFKRLQKEAKALPDLILIDGGPTQLSAARKALAELAVRGPVLVGVSKGEGRKPGLETLHFTDRPPLHLSPDSVALHFIQQIRDEAHRFAITGHRQRRDKKRRTSVLESIPGIGAIRRRALLQHFGGIQGVEAASVEQLMEVQGMTSALAEEVYGFFHHH